MCHATLYSPAAWFMPCESTGEAPPQELGITFWLGHRRENSTSPPLHTCMPPIKHLTPHALRATFITLALEGKAPW